MCGKKLKLKKNNIIFYLLIVFFAAVFLFSAVKLVQMLIIEPYTLKQQSSGLHTEITVPQAEDGVWESDELSEEQEQSEQQDGQDILISMQQALEANSDTKGWIYIPGTQINYPVLQSSNGDNEYYLHRDLNGEKVKHGCIFLDNSVTVTENVSDVRNYVLYGHNMKNGTMFHDLVKYSKLDFYKTYPVLQFDTIYSNQQWVIFAVMKCNADAAREEVFNFYRSSFSSDKAFLNFISQIKSRSVIESGIDVNASDTLLTLVTCSYEYKNIRTVVVARMLREGETSIDVSGAKKASNPVMPSFWKKGW